jgi:phthiocerol/phenolphthiocerol synthesis type-I polyketide synthase E
VLSPDGHCRAFDAAAAGSVEGNGCGVVVLRRLGDALAAGDRIYAVIRGSAVNNDGAAKVGFTAPSVAGQAEVVSESLMMADVPAATIGYVEAHGSGTPLGDPIEIAALTQAFRAAGARGDGFCAVGSVKTAIGHCNTAAGAAGLIKAALALAHRTIPPSLHFETPNPQIDFAASPFYVPTAAAAWEAAGAPRRAGVSSFGLGGTNVHMVLEEAPAAAPSAPPARPAELLVLSARTAAALDAAAGRLADHLAARAELDARGMADVAWTLQAGRKAFKHRRAVVARDRAGAIAALREGAGAGPAIAGQVERGTRSVVFLFPGLGDQRVDMARELYATETFFRDEVDRAAAKLALLLGADLRQVMFSPEPVTPAAGAGPNLRALLRRDGAAAVSAAEARLRRTLFAQPAGFVIEHALGRLLMSWGIVPQALLGYSVGEYVAACLAGSLDLDDALTLVAERAKLIDALPAGAMLAVPLPEEELRPLLGGDLSLAATNGPHFSVAAGPVAAVDDLERRLAARGVATVRLRTTHAFHSAAMEPAVAALTRAARGIAMRPPRIPWISNVTGTWITAADLADPAYWARHMRGTVRFAEGLAELLREPDRAFVEVGPGATLGTLVQQHPAAANPVTVATLGRAEEGGGDLEALLAAAGRLWAAGVEVDWARFQGAGRRRKVPLPSYPFERQRYWIEPSPGARRAGVPAGAPAEAADLADWFWVPAWTRLPLAAPPRPAEEGREERCLLFLDGIGLGERLAARLRARGQAVATVATGDGFAALGDGAFAVGPRRMDHEALFRHLQEEAGGVPERIVHLGGLTAGEPTFEEAHAAGLASVLLLAQAVSGAGGAGGEPIRLALVANGLAQVLDGDPVHPGKGTLLGAAKVVHQELPRLAVAAIDAALPATGDGPALDRLAGQILAEMSEPAQPLIALRGRQRFVRGFAPVRLAENGTPPRLIPQGVYLIAGAAHGPGMAIAGHLLRLGARVGLLLPGDLPPRERWESWSASAGVPPEQDAIGSAVRCLLDLEREVGLERALVVRSDDPAAAGRAAAETAARFGPLTGAFWTGGALAGGLLQWKTPESLAAALEPVARGAAALLAALDAASADAAPPPFAVLSSTTTALTGGVGQLELAASGSYLEALAARRAAADHGAAPAVAVHWDPYHWGSWLAAGVAGGMSNLSAEDLQAGLRAHGVAPERSAAALERLLGGLPEAPAVAVTARDLPGLVAEVDSVTAETLLAQMAAGHAEKAARPALRTPFMPPQGELEGRIAAIWQELFGIEPIGRDDSFLELGGHSLLAIQIVTQLRQALDADLPVTALFEAPTVAQLAAAVRQARGGPDPDELEALLALVEELSPEEAAERLAEF